MKNKILRIINKIKITLYIWKNEKKYQNRLKYLLIQNKDSSTLLIIFSGFPGNSKAKYNYMKTLENVNCNKLFILDDFGYKKRGSYYLGENGNYYVEQLVLELIEEIKFNLNIDKLITIGSSKGGTSAIYYGLKENASYVISGAPQYYLTNYLDTEDKRNILYGIIGRENIEFNKKYLNSLLEKTIQDNIDTKTKIYLHYSNREHTYKEHIKYLLHELKKNNIEVIEDMNDYVKHSDVALYFPHFINTILEKEER